jgi:hypothetical protein
LLTDKGAGLWITDKGIATVERLSVSKAAPPPEYPYVWVWRNSKKAPLLNSRKSQRCRVLVRSKRMNSALIEFEDGYRVNTSRTGIRRAAQSIG